MKRKGGYNNKPDDVIEIDSEVLQTVEKKGAGKKLKKVVGPSIPTHEVIDLDSYEPSRVKKENAKERVDIGPNIPMHEVIDLDSYQLERVKKESDVVEIDSNISEQEEEGELVGTMKGKIVGVRYYRGVTSEGEAVRLEREPHNPYDGNAIVVRNIMGVQIGHINKELAVILAPLMDSNRVIIEAECIGIRTQYMQPILYSFYGKPDIREIIGLSQETKASVRLHSTGPSSSRQFQLLEGSGSSRLDANNMDEFYSSTLNQEELNICEQPSMVQTKLLRHQLQALKWCRSQENLTINDEKAIQFWKKLPGGQFQNLATNSTVAQEPKLVSGGILADDMGLGKTLTMISLLASDESPETKHNLIICPLSVVENWTKQITDHLFNSNLKVYVYHGSDKSNNEKFLKKQNIVISTYQTIASVYHEKRKLGPFAINWDRVILDEGHIIKNHKTKLAKAAISIMSKNRWVVTGTPITNKIEDLYSILKFLNYTPFDSEEFWKKCFQRPIKRGLEIGNQNLRALIKDIMIRRTKATTYQGEKIVKLPKCTVYTDYLQFTTDQMVEYQRIKAVFKQRIIEFMENDSMDKNGLIVLEMLTRLRQFCDHPSLVPVGYEEKIKNSLDEANLDEARMIELLKSAYESGEECCICMEDLKEAVITCCRHMFCDPCLDTSMKTKNACPLCRRPLTAKDIFRLPAEKTEEVKEDLELKDSPKTARLSEFLKSTPKTVKTVVFSQWTGMLKIVSKSLEKQGIKHIQFDGSLTLNNRKKVLDTFRNTSCNVLLMSIKAGSLGINLVEANQVIMLDPWWNTAIESQAIDRVFRIGQTKDVNVVRFVIKGSIEEKVLEIQERKNKIIEKALSGIKGANEKAAKKERMKDIKSLFEIA